MSLFHIKLKRARAYTRLFQLKLLVLIVYIGRFDKLLGAYYCPVNIYVNCFDVEAQCEFFTYARFLIKKLRVIQSQTAQNGSQNFSGRISDPLFFSNKYSDQKLFCMFFKPPPYYDVLSFGKKHNKNDDFYL